jgi:hypothetical protein
VRDIAARHLQQVRRKLDELKALEGSLSAFVFSCDSACAGGPAVSCTILEDLSLPVEQVPIVGQGGCCGSGLGAGSE